MSSFFIIKNQEPIKKTHCGRAKLCFWKIAPLALVLKYLELSLKKNEKAQKITNMLRTSLTLDTENKNLGMVMKYFLTRLTNLNCNFILTESVRF